MAITKRIHINQHRLRQGLPAVTIQSYKGPQYARRVRVEGVTEVIHAEKPLSCGARCWVETKGDVQIIEE